MLLYCSYQAKIQKATYEPSSRLLYVEKNIENMYKGDLVTAMKWV